MVYAMRSTKSTLALFVLTGASFAALATSSTTVEAVQNATYYSWGAVGTPATESAGEVAARDLARNYSSTDVIKLIPDARPEGKLYLLCVLRKVSPQDYAKAKALAGFSKDTKVSTFTGNVLTSEAASDVVRQIETSNCSALNWATSKRREK